MEPFSSIAFYSFLGMPLVAYGGMLALLLLLATAFTGYSMTAGKMKFSVEQHKILAFTAVIVSLAHGLLVFLALLR